MRSAARILPLLSLLLVAPRAARADIPPYDFNWAYIHDEGNAAYPGGPPIDGNKGRGSVSYGYRISRLEITTAQWADFLNMALRQGVNLNQYALKPSFWGASQAGSQFAVSKPLQGVLGLNWRAGAYYCNWLTNGKQESWASCQSGAYDASTFSGVPGQPYTDQLTHSPGAKFWIPTLDEYLKASHYDPNRNGQGQGGWWDQPYRSNTAAIPGPPPPGTGQTSGGWDPGDFSELSVNLGAYTNSTSAYGLWDLSGAAKEWLEDPVTFDSATGLYKRRRVFGSYAGERAYFGRDSVNSTDFDYPAEDGFYGFRVAGQVPAPSVVTVAFVGISGFLFRRKTPTATASTMPTTSRPMNGSTSGASTAGSGRTEGSIIANGTGAPRTSISTRSSTARTSTCSRSGSKPEMIAPTSTSTAT